MSLQCGEDRHVLGREVIRSRFENVCQLAFIYKYGSLTLSNDELCTVIDFVLIALKTVGNGIVCLIHPLDNINKFMAELLSDLINNSHGLGFKVDGLKLQKLGMIPLSQ
jgi:hypothetical protein